MAEGVDPAGAHVLDFGAAAGTGLPVIAVRGDPAPVQPGRAADPCSAGPPAQWCGR
ncbi:hypothetical protein ACN6LA_007241 [Streptomyces sp. SAS_269]|uniref:hypothetical protein n=1 Tax=Streptomyces sp. SAS_269 TaxID=3412749 RepID=UPI00403D4A52